MPDDGPKREAAKAAVERYVASGMVVGLGTGSTATFAVRRIGELVASGELRGRQGCTDFGEDHRPCERAWHTACDALGGPSALYHRRGR